MYRDTSGLRTRLMLGTALVICALIFIVAGARIDSWLSTVDSSSQPPLRQPLRLVVERDDGFREFLLALRVHHYRVKPIGEYRYEDVFFDTSEWDLYRNGLMYRFRTILESADGPKYAIQLQQEPQLPPDIVGDFEWSGELPTSLGDEIAGGSWDLVTSVSDSVSVSKRLGTILRELQIEPDRLQPQLIVSLDISRFDVTDKGRIWFGLDHELWGIRTFGDTALFNEEFEEIVIESRLRGDDVELYRRVTSMSELANMVSGVQPTILDPFEHAVSELSP